MESKVCIKTVCCCSLNALIPTDFLTSPLHLMSSLAPDIGMPFILMAPWRTHQKWCGISTLTTPFHSLINHLFWLPLFVGWLVKSIHLGIILMGPSQIQAPLTAHLWPPNARPHIKALLVRFHRRSSTSIVKTTKAATQVVMMVVLPQSPSQSPHPMATRLCRPWLILIWCVLIASRFWSILIWLPRLWLSLRRCVIRPTYTSSSSSRKNMSIPLQGRLWKGTGAQFVSKYYFFSTILISLTTITQGMTSQSSKRLVSWLGAQALYACTSPGTKAMSTSIANSVWWPMSYCIPMHFSMCKLVPMWMGRQCLSHLLNTDHGSPRQTFLDGVVTHEPRIPAFTSAGLLNFIIKLIVCEDEVSRTSFCTCIVLICLCTLGIPFSLTDC